MTFTVLRREDHAEMPWLNGGGRTLEVARAPRTGDFDWRVSFAHVDRSGPFSAYPGVDRVITLVEGPGMRLTIRPQVGPGSAGSGSVVHELAPYEPCAFAGEDEIDCQVTQPTVDLNLMTRRDRCRGTVTTHRIAGGRMEVDPAGATLVAILAGRLRAESGSTAAHVAPLDVLTDLTATVTLSGGGVAALIQVTPG
ncbi:HutD family protein [Arsenicicoccus dermatophilus]|uniref:HutD/Ves family protein n=1 Tax=Arsenicicoccus dermatophilus TaxID=1076331 RepID=UPI001F4D071E|nr:HutD family protein [Arsenicicoccus dermatophilus]MCH8611478.1 HutD family protein [Arsenicicoccus dermatophilus]